VREIAVDVGVNPNTVQRALAEMEREGLCRSERTAGRFVTDDMQRIDRVRAALVQDAADDYIRRARGLGMGRSLAQDLLVQRWSDHDDSADRDDDQTAEAGGE
jgi:DNA-binding transcriptional regulator YhcF (GntR family)